MRRSLVFLGMLFLAYSSIAGAQVKAASALKRGDWPEYGGSAADLRYSPLKQINRKNVKSLEVAWTYPMDDDGWLRTSPIVVRGILYGITPSQMIFALNAATGKEIWKFSSGIPGSQPDRSLVYWEDGDDQRIIVGVMNFVYELNARTGRPITSFGDNGRIDLCNDLGRKVPSDAITITSPGVVYKDLVIFGAREPEMLPAPPGDVRAYDIRTGKLRWSFHTIPHPGEFGYDTWPKDAWTYSGGANNWAGMALDEARGIVYVPTGSAAPDFYGANRLGDDLFANSLLALNAATGQRIWHFQTVKHDLWDRDLPAPPALVTVQHGGHAVDAVAQTTKSGFVYLFDRTNGNPLFPIEYRAYPASTVPGEQAAASQPLPTKPAPFARQYLTEDMLTKRTPEAHEWAVKQFRTFRSEGQFVPFGTDKPTVIFPGFDGGAEWGGPAVDPKSDVMYVNSTDIAWTGLLAKNTLWGQSSGQALYMNRCSVCHRDDRKGSPPDFPSLVDVGKRLSAKGITEMIVQGRGRMPPFSSLKDDELAALIGYLVNNENRELIRSTKGKEEETPYNFTGYHKFLDPDGYPAVEPPWGTLNAIDLNTGNYLWKVPLGEYPDLAAQGIKSTGTENYGGPIVTAGGLIFIASTIFDNKFRAFDTRSGEILWETTLPYSGRATPISYETNGRQYVVIAATMPYDKKVGVYVAFTLPKSRVKGSQSVSHRSAPSN